MTNLFNWAEKNNSTQEQKEQNGIDENSIAPPNAGLESRALTPSQINEQVRKSLETKYGNVIVKGEISGFKKGYNGHCYFTIKDKNAALSAALFAGNARFLKTQPKEGDEYFALGKLTLYPKSGRYQIVVQKLIPAGGQGSLLKKFEEIKKKLHAEGLFSAEVKKELPFFPQTIGVVTSPSGAVIQDIIQVARRRFEKPKILLLPASVQGDFASKEIVQAIEYANTYKKELGLNALIVGRGGGSIEDLWCFNEEIVARAIVSSELPIVTAIGHETDHTIADFVADYRAATPSAAAEILFPEIEVWQQFFSEKAIEAQQIVQRQISDKKNKIQLMNSKILDPSFLTQKYRNTIDNQFQEINGLMVKWLNKIKNNFNQDNLKLSEFNPALVVANQKQKLMNLEEQLHKIQIQTLNNIKNKFQLKCSQIDAFSPLKTLQRGYALVKNEKNDLIQSTKQVQNNELLNIQVSDGSLTVKVAKTNP